MRASRMKKNINFYHIFMLAAGLSLLFSCQEDTPYPKPRGYFRIQLPAKSYLTFDTIYPYKFEYPVYAKPRFKNGGEDHWLNLDFPYFNASIYFSYKPVKDNLEAYINDAYTLVNKLIPKADAIEKKIYDDKDKQVFGVVYTIEGSQAASVLQFFLTDSTRHFVRGALYFNNPPNNDSLQPVIGFLNEDIRHLIETFEWKNFTKQERNTQVTGK